MTPNEPNVNCILDPVVEAVLDQFDPELGALEKEFFSLAELEQDSEADAVYLLMIDAIGDMYGQAIRCAFWAGAAFGSGAKNGISRVEV